MSMSKNNRIKARRMYHRESRKLDRNKARRLQMLTDIKKTMVNINSASIKPKKNNQGLVAKFKKLFK